MNQIFREYIVTLRDKIDLTQFYLDMENETNLSFVPSRPVYCTNKRPVSRNTHYLISDNEANALKNDPRVESITLNLTDIGVKARLHSDQTAEWSRADTVEVGQKNWGLYRMSQTVNPDGWGSEQGTGNITTNLKFRSTGKNVDIVIVDDIVYPDHSEYSDRFVEYDWFGELDQAVRGPATDISQVSRTGNQATITTAAPHVLFPGSVIKVVCTSDPTFNTNNAVIISTQTSTTFTYTNTGSDVGTTEGTGYWTGIYQYDRFNGLNNHATHVAAVVAGNTQGWAREANLYNLRHDTTGISAGEYVPREYIFDYIRAFHSTKPINSETGRKNPTLVNCSWGLGKTVAGGFVANPITQNSAFSRLFHKGEIVTAESLGNAIVDTGFSGVCNASTRLAELTNLADGGNEIITTGSNEAVCSGIPKNILGRAGLANFGEPTGSSTGGVDIYDDAFWTIQLPFDVEYAGAIYGPGPGASASFINISSNSSIFFGGTGAMAYDLFIGQGGPQIRKIHISANDRSCQNLWAGESGTTPNRTYRVRWEGHDGAYGGDALNPTMVWEATFFENDSNKIELHFDQNAAYRGEFTSAQLENFGIMQNGNPAPYRDPTIDADVSDLLDDGIFFVGSAGNGKFKVDEPAGEDYTNYFIENGLAYEYHKGASPGASQDDIICVGALAASTGENKFQLSNTGPRVDLYAPGANVMSAVFDETGFTQGASTTIVNDGSIVLLSGDIQSLSRNSSLSTTTVTTVANHGLTNGDLIIVRSLTDGSFNASMVSVSVTSPTTFTYSNVGSDETNLTLEDITISSGYHYQKYNGSSVAAAQVSGLLALLLETFPTITQAEAKEYLLQNSIEGFMTVSNNNAYTDDTSLQGGANKIAYYYKERPTEGLVFPKPKEKSRPVSGMIFPRSRIIKS